jgi:hypothetical protein
METLMSMEVAGSLTCKPPPPTQTGLPTLARFLAKVYDDHVAPHETKRALFEPRWVATPDGYHSTKCVAAGLYALLTQARLAAEDGEVLPTEITGSTFCYRVLEHGVPIYFVDEEFARAVAATQLPDDFTFGDLNWPQSGMVVGWPPRFLLEYTGREFCYVYAANCPAGRYWPKGLEHAPVIEVPEGRSKIGWFYHAWANGRPECFVSAYLTKDKLAEGITSYTYTDFMGEGVAKVQADKELTELDWWECQMLRSENDESPRWGTVQALVGQLAEEVRCQFLPHEFCAVVWGDRICAHVRLMPQPTRSC